MSYHKTSIERLIKDIHHKKVFLPALQRKFVWGRYQITMLFDSLMRNYPFGTFLFWKLHREKAENYVFYEFLKHFDVRSPYNTRKQGVFTYDEIIGVLDGQQRLSSMYVGLLGSHTEKAPYKRWSNPDAFEEMWLHLDLLALPFAIDSDRSIKELEDRDYPFEFLTMAEAKRTHAKRELADGSGSEDCPACWFKVGEVLGWSGDPDFDDVIDQLVEKSPTPEQKAALQDQRRLVRKGLETLHRRICRDELISYFEVAKDDLEDILKIFVRVNSGGTVLSKTDLLFSTIVATWDDGRDQIEALERRLNDTGEGFKFGNEFLMRACLMLTDAPVLFDVRSFKAENVERIRHQWPQIADALVKMANLLSEFGFDGTTLTSQNATLLIAYHLHKGGALDPKSKEGLRQYLLRSLLLGIYGSSQDQLLTFLRNALKADGGTGLKSAQFDFGALAKLELPQGKSLAVTDDDLERILDSTKGYGGFAVLSLLYPHLRFNEVTFHQDHIHPYSGFSKSFFEKQLLSEEERNEWLSRRDRVANLQLLEGKRNQSKSDQPIIDWFGDLADHEAVAYRSTHYFPSDVELDFTNFRNFYDARRSLLKAKLGAVLDAWN
ncbi:MAG TPA: DUF262 domain-containing protein [Haloferula sp.]